MIGYRQALTFGRRSRKLGVKRGVSLAP